MEKDIDVIARHAERRGDVLAVALLEHAECDDGALRVAELGDARAQTDVFFGAGERVFGGDFVAVRGVVVERNMRA